MILDLTVFKEKYLEVKMSEDLTVNLPRPSQRMVIRMQQVSVMKSDTDEEEVMKELNDLVYEILNSNKEGVEIAKKQVEELPQAAKLRVLEGYVAFMRELQSNPT